MRMWNVSTRLMCDRHLIMEHVDMLRFAKHVEEGDDLDKYIRKGVLEIHNIKYRHDNLVKEMNYRGLNPLGDLEFNHPQARGKIDRIKSLNVLLSNCPDCWERSAEQLQLSKDPK